MAMVLQALASKGTEHSRAGEYETAASMLSRADDLRRSVLQRPSEIPVLAYLTMAQHRLGRSTEAQALLSRLRNLCEQRDVVLEQHERCLWEAEKTLVGNGSVVAEIWDEIETGRLQQAAEGLAQLKTASDLQIAGHFDDS
jgi:hypothetical protein